MIMQRYSGDLREFIESQTKSKHEGHPPFSEPVSFSIIVQLALGLKNLHRSGIYHRDIKCSNILVHRNLDKVLLPSGALDMIVAIAISDFETSDDVQGTGFWRAPEVLQCLEDKVPVSGFQWEAADIYSFGMTCYEILTGRSPFHDRRWSDYEVVLTGGRPELPADVHEGLKDIIQRCLHQDPKDRPSFADIVHVLKQIEEYNELWEAGFNKAEKVMLWESSLRTPDAIFLELTRLVVTDRTFDRLRSKKLLWASKFVCSMEQFVSKFGWDSYIRHPSLPFAEFVERDKLCVLTCWQHLERFAIVGKAEEKIYLLMGKVMFKAAYGFMQSIYSGQDHDEDLTLSDKLSIIQRDFVKPLFDAGVRKVFIFVKTQRLVHQASSNECYQGEIGKIHLRYFITVLLLLVREYGWRVGRLPDILLSRLAVKFLTEQNLSFPSKSIQLPIQLLRRHLFTGSDGRSFNLLKVFFGWLAVYLFILGVALLLQLKLLGYIV